MLGFCYRPEAPSVLGLSSVNPYMKGLKTELSCVEARV